MDKFRTNDRINKHYFQRNYDKIILQAKIQYKKINICNIQKPNFKTKK